MFSPLMIVLLTGRSLNDYSRFSLVKVRIFKNFFLHFRYAVPVVILVRDSKLDFGGNSTVTAVDSGRRALQLLGLDEERTSAGFDVKVITAKFNFDF